MAQFICKKTGVTNSEIVMVGDRLSTDILFGKNCDFTTVLVLSGDTNQTMAQDSEIKANLVIKDVNKLVNLV